MECNIGFWSPGGQTTTMITKRRRKLLAISICCIYFFLYGVPCFTLHIPQNPLTGDAVAFAICTGWRVVDSTKMEMRISCEVRVTTFPSGCAVTMGVGQFLPWMGCQIIRWIHEQMVFTSAHTRHVGELKPWYLFVYLFTYWNCVGHS